MDDRRRREITEALFKTEELLQRLAVQKHRAMHRHDAQEILRIFPTKFDMMKMAEESHLLDAETAQKMCDCRLHLDLK